MVTYASNPISVPNLAAWLVCWHCLLLNNHIQLSQGVSSICKTYAFCVDSNINMFRDISTQRSVFFIMCFLVLLGKQSVF